MKKNVSKTREQKLAKGINQMDGWMQNKTRLILAINTPLFCLSLYGRVIRRQEDVFTFDSYGETCRILVIPEHYDRTLCRKDPASVTYGAVVTFETSEMQGSLQLIEDCREARFEEMCTDWVLSNMVAEAGRGNEVP